ncbi:MAG: DUF6069 family protein [Actinomycetales bacterium]|jgi:hypothetical protein|nr:DUF6069 family protein [Leifsonia sp.]
MTRTLIPASHKNQRLRRSRRLRRAGTVAAASVVAVIVWIIAVPAAGLDLVVHSGPTTQTVGLASVVIVPVAAGAAAWVTLAILERMARRARLLWMIVAVTVLALSLLGPISLAVGAGTVWALLTMHVVVGATLIFGLTRFAAPRDE